MDIIIKKQELEDISSLLPTIIYNELLKFTEEPISIEGDVTIPTTESVVETKIDKSVLLIKIKLFKKALEKDKGNKVLKIKIKLFEKELTKYADGGGVEGRKKIMELYSQEVSDLRRKSYPKISVSQAVKLASEYMLLNYSKEELKEAINNDRQIQLFGMQNTWLNALNKANKYADGGGVGKFKKGDKVTDGRGNVGIIKQVQSNGNLYIQWVSYSGETTTDLTADNDPSDFEKLDDFANGGGVDKVYKLIDGENTWYLTYLDSTHFFLINTKEYKGSPYHIGEFRSRPFYNEVLSWLNSNKGKMAKGGGVDYNENREMVLNDNKQIAHHTKELQNAVKGKKVPAWVVAKINRSSTDISDSTHYMEGQGDEYADGGSIKIGDKVMLPEIKMRDGKIQFEKVENGEVIEIQDGIYSVLNPKTNRIHKVSVNQIKFNNGGSLDEFLDKKRMELNSYSDERIAKFYSALKDIDYTDTLIELKGNEGERRNMIQELMDELTIRHNVKNKNKFEGGGVLNGNYLDTISADKKNKILKNIANNYGFSIAEALAEVVDADAEMLYEYISNDQLLRMSVYNDIEGGKFAKGGGTSKIWIVNIAMPTSNNNMPKLIKKEIELGRMSNEFDVKQAILRKGGDWLGNGKVLSVYEKK